MRIVSGDISNVSGYWVTINDEGSGIRLRLHPDKKKELEEELEASPSDDVLRFVFGDFVSDHNFMWIHPEDISALTDSPIIGYDVSINDDGTIKFYDTSRIWWYPDYQVSDPVKELIEKGDVFFPEALRDGIVLRSKV